MRSSARRLALASFLASTAIAAAPALAQDAPQGDVAAEEAGYGDIIVTAQKRSESLQNVPISIQALGTEKLQDLNISDFSGYAQQLPSVTFQGTGTPGVNVIYMRGVASGGDGNHSGSLPSVGVYLDEQPVTTIGGNLDVHIYDIARIESLSGPQGTLYGASSQAGTIRIITNKPDPSGFSGSMDGELNTVASGDIGGKFEAYVNAPLSDRAAIRIVGFYQHSGGFIDNVAGSRRFLGTPILDANGDRIGNLPDGIVANNAAFVEENYNDTDSFGLRAALGVELNDSWTVTPSVMYQNTETNGVGAFDPSVGDLQVQHFFPEFRTDKFIQAGLTIEGKLGNWDMTYAGAYLDRRTASSADYTDYSEAYDTLYANYVDDNGDFLCSGLSGCLYFSDSAGNTIDPRQKVIGSDHFKKLSQEVRISSPSDGRLRVVAGLFYQRQTNDIHQDYQVRGLGPLVSVNGFPGTLWLTQQYRVDRDYAAFGEASFDITDQLSFTAGLRGFKYDNTLIGFFGFGRNPGSGFSAGPPNASGSNRTGVAQCFTTSNQRLYNRDTDTYATSRVLIAPVVAGSPCTNLGVVANGTVSPVQAKGDGVTWRFNLNYKPNNDLLVYATASRGFRPGGINRRADVAPYDPDYLINYEFGWKTTLAPGLRFNGAIYQQNWNSFQFSFLGANSFTEIHNGPNARIRGVDLDLGYNSGGLSLNVAAAYTDAKMTRNLCAFDDPTFTCAGAGNSIASPTGTRLPITPQWKVSGTARYTVESGNAKYYGQINGSYQSSASSEVRATNAAIIGILPSFGSVNLAFGAEWDSFHIEAFASNLFDERGQLSRFLQCGQCGVRPYAVPIQPRTFGIRAGVNF